MIFKPELADAIVNGQKTATRRRCSDNPNSPWWRGGCKYRVGQIFAVQPGRGKKSVGAARVTRVALERLGAITLRDARREGFGTLTEFDQTWAGINGGWDPNEWVWVIEFEVVGIQMELTHG